MNILNQPAKILALCSLVTACDYAGDMSITTGPEGTPQAISLKGGFNTKEDEGGTTFKKFKESFALLAEHTPISQPVKLDLDGSLGGVSGVADQITQFLERASRPSVLNCNNHAASTAARLFTSPTQNVTRNFNDGCSLHIHPSYVKAKNMGVSSYGYFTPEAFRASMHYLEDPTLSEIPVTLDNGDEVYVERDLFVERADDIARAVSLYTGKLEIASNGRVSKEEWDQILLNGTVGGSAPARGFVIRDGNTAAYFGLTDLVNGEVAPAEDIARAGKRQCDQLRNNTAQHIRICNMDM